MLELNIGPVAAKHMKEYKFKVEDFTEIIDAHKQRPKTAMVAAQHLVDPELKAQLAQHTSHTGKSRDDASAASFAKHYHHHHEGKKPRHSL